MMTSIGERIEMTKARVFNFAAGPATMPLSVLEEAQRDLVALPGVGMSVMEISHRSKTFEDILNQAINDIRELAAVPSNYRILLLQAGSALQKQNPVVGWDSGQFPDVVDRLVEDVLKRLGPVADFHYRHADARQRHQIPLSLFQNGKRHRGGTCGKVENARFCHLNPFANRSHHSEFNTICGVLSTGDEL